ncbi:MAG TPA: ABC transporter ATP-binding protein [Candidatus Fimivicinus intestinavium]|nr:ABC transporter ATP-binding protein [Candidatus Fimivicinus intestinavium]
MPAQNPKTGAEQGVPLPTGADIVVQNVTMQFRRAKDEAVSLKELIIRSLRGDNRYEMFRALDHVSFTVEKGEVVGIIGTNGSGKSTLLKIISGALYPTSGRVWVDRSKVQLLTLGTGFDPELTGRENVYLNGAIIGYTKQYIDQKYEEIVRFAELEGFMEEKVRNYSSGMVSRLGFAIATARDTPEILILDEVLSVGDLFFRRKSEARIREMIHAGSTVLIVSHTPAVIRNNCTKAVWIEKGRLQAVGAPEEVCDAYEKMRQG